MVTEDRMRNNHYSRATGLFLRTKNGRPSFVATVILVGILVVLLLYYYHTPYPRRPPKFPKSWNLSFSRGTTSTSLTDITFHEDYGLPKFQSDCLQSQKFSRSISDIYKMLKIAKSSTASPECQYISRIFENLIQLDEIETSLQLPGPFTLQVKSWLGNNAELFQEIYRQKVYKVVSNLTGEETIFNTLRSKRPVSKSTMDPIKYIEELVSESAPSCDFCSYKEHTAMDIFGRIESIHSATASNTFKLSKFHGLFFPYAHHPLNLSYDVLQDLFLTTSMAWFEKAYSADPTQRFPTLLWDSLPHAGASQVHPHVHGLTDSKQYAGIFETIHTNSKKYWTEYGRSVWTDFILIHQALGLTVREGNAVALVPITARKDHEFWIISPTLNENVIKLLHRVLTAYRTKLNTFCHSSGISYPLLGRTMETSNEGLPVIFRIGSRGDCTVLRSDVSSLELYTVNNINSNLEETISALEHT